MHTGSRSWRTRQRVCGRSYRRGRCAWTWALSPRGGPRPHPRSPAHEIGLERPAFVKADVECTELAVPKGGSATLRRHRPTPLPEIERRHLAKYGVDPADVLRHLRDIGYRAHRRGAASGSPSPASPMTVTTTDSPPDHLRPEGSDQPWAPP
ncbi:FkbM family methyltransferase [Streptomyces sp. V4I23]|uniref:FkbM family methyltransferase n=1 Tax=Streptomyces sp. V4I23 TaxID=3042282 RepID=UPI00358EE514